MITNQENAKKLEWLHQTVHQTDWFGAPIYWGGMVNAKNGAPNRTVWVHRQKHRTIPTPN